MAESTTPPLLPRTSRSPPSSRCATASSRCCSGNGRESRTPGRGRSPAERSPRDETLEESILRHLATKVDVREVAHLEQLGTWSEPARHPERWELGTAYLGLVPLGVDPRIPDDTRWQPVDAMPPTAFDHGAIVLAGRDRLRGKLSYSNIGFALAPETFTLAELRDVYEAALGYEVSATNLKRVLLRRGAIESVGRRRAHGPGRWAARGALPLPRAPLRGHRSVRGVPSSGVRA